MKVAIATNNKEVSGHFGHCEGFTIVKFDEKKLIQKDFIKSPKHQPGVLPRFLSNHGVNSIVAGGMGKKAQDIFNHEGIEVFVGITGSVDEVIQAFQNNTLKSTDSICQDHMHHNENCDH